jgi:hypothetical protein
MANTGIHVRQPLFGGVASVPKNPQAPKAPSLAYWKTPGAFLANAIAALPEVVFVGERFADDTHSVIVLLKQDPEGTLDAIYSAEQKLYKEFPKAKFSVRVRTGANPSSIESLAREYVIRWVKPENG